MRIRFDRARLATIGGLLIAGTVAFADGTRFSDFTPLAASAGPTADESRPLTFGNPAFQQRSIADRHTQLAAGKPNGLSVANDASGWDMNTLNETGDDKGRYLFTVFEGEWPGVQRHDLLTGATDTIWSSYPLALSGTPDSASSFDPAFWTPWGTLITAEEGWGGPTNYGRLFEFKNLTTHSTGVAPGSTSSSRPAAMIGRSRSRSLAVTTNSPFRR